MRAIHIIIFLAFGASLSASLSLPETLPPPGQRTFTQLLPTAEIPLADSSLVAPVARREPSKAKGDEPSLVASGLKVTSVVLTNDPALRVVAFSGIPLRVGARIPEELLPGRGDTRFYIKEIDAGRVLLDMRGAGDASIPVEIRYDFSARSRRKK